MKTIAALMVCLPLAFTPVARADVSCPNHFVTPSQNADCYLLNMPRGSDSEVYQGEQSSGSDQRRA